MNQAEMVSVINTYAESMANVSLIVYLIWLAGMLLVVPSNLRHLDVIHKARMHFGQLVMVLYIITILTMYADMALFYAGSAIFVACTCCTRLSRDKIFTHKGV